MPITTMIVKESLRLYPPVDFIERLSSQETILGGYHIPEEADVMVSLYALHRNANMFKKPERFDPLKFSEHNEPQIPKFGYIPFSVGSRRCPGRLFASHMMKVMLYEIYKIADITVVKDHKHKRSLQYDMMVNISTETSSCS
jgi:cytochrome P450